eukprot:NODE_190_length_13461_cov_0.525595.p1 type:complete len:447 gc:universal NODE_190_length_13461_cov_0.525595:432-1772(+)
MLLLLLFMNLVNAVTDCDKVYYLAVGLGMDINPTKLNTIKQDCCTSAGVTCNGASVTSIIWNSNALGGTINASSIPSNLIRLYLSSNSITGDLPSEFPDSLQDLIADSNALTGNITKWPASMTSVDISYNSISGVLPAIPSGCTNFVVAYNQFSGRLPAVTGKLVTYDVDNNLLTGSVNYYTFDILQSFDCSFNLFSGTVPDLSGKSSLKSLYYNDNKFVGDITNRFPKILTTFSISNNQFYGTVELNKPIQVQINGNYITDVIIHDVTAITFGCQLGNNPLLGNMRLSDYSVCDTTGIYNASDITFSLGSSTTTASTVASTTSLKMTTTTFLLATTKTIVTRRIIAPTTTYRITSTTVTSTVDSARSKISEITTTARNNIFDYVIADPSTFEFTILMAMRVFVDGMIFIAAVLTTFQLRRKRSKLDSASASSQKGKPSQSSQITK